jgi:hypothetical protein
VVRPIEKLWVGIMTVMALGFMGVIAGGSISDGKPIPWLALLIWIPLPLMPTSSAGFDVDVERRTVRVWESWGFFRYKQVTLPRLAVPDVRSMHRLGTDTKKRTRVRLLYWGSRFIPASLAKSTLTELVAEARQLIESAG